MRTFAILFCCLFQHLGLQAQVLTEENIWDLGQINEFIVSPDGNKIVYGVKKVDLKANTSDVNVFIYDKLTKVSKPFIAGNGSPVGLISHTPTNKIYFLFPVNNNMQLFEINWDGTGMKQRTSIQDGIDDFTISESSSAIVFVKEVHFKNSLQTKYPELTKATGRLYNGLMYRHWTSWDLGNRNHVFYTQLPPMGTITDVGKDLLENEPFDCPIKPLGGIENVAISPNGEWIAYVCKKLSGTEAAVSTNTDIYLYNTLNGKTENISTWNTGYDTEPKFTKDGKLIYWLSMATPGYEADQNQLILYSITNRTHENISKTLDITIQSCIESVNPNEFIIEIPTEGTVQLYVLKSDFKTKTSTLKPITKGWKNVTGFKWFAKGKKPSLLVSYTTMLRPNELFEITLDGNEQQLTNENTGFLATLKQPVITQKWITTTDQQKMLVWLILPPNFDTTKRYPALLYCQGGPQSMIGQSFSTRWNFRLMASKGYVVIAPLRRGMPGFGKKWNEDISGNWGSQAMQDMLTATDSIATLPYIDRNRMGAVGASFGGYTVYWLAGNHNKRFKTFISHCGIYNTESFFGTTEELFFANFDFKGSYWDNNNNLTYNKFSPHLFAKNWDTPLLVIHNEKDFRVPLAEGMQAFTAAQLQAVPSAFLYFPDEGHWVTKPQNSVMWNKVFFEWLGETLKP